MRKFVVLSGSPPSAHAAIMIHAWQAVTANRQQIFAPWSGHKAGFFFLMYLQIIEIIYLVLIIQNY